MKSQEEGRSLSCQNEDNKTLVNHNLNGLRYPLQVKVDYNAVIPPSKKISMLNNDLHRIEQLSGIYYLKGNSPISTNEISYRNKQQYQQNSQLQNNNTQDYSRDKDTRYRIIEQNNGVLGLLNKTNIENQQQTLLNKRKQSENYRIKNNNSNLSTGSTGKILTTSTEALLPPNYKAQLSRRNKSNQSPFAARTIFAQDVKITNKFYANSRPLLNASILHHTYKTPNLKNNNDDSSTSESSDSSDD